MTPSEIQAARLDAARKVAAAVVGIWTESWVREHLRDEKLAEVIGEWEVSAQREEQPSGDQAAKEPEPPASPMSPREALLAAVRAVAADYGNINPMAPGDDYILALVPEEARHVLLDVLCFECSEDHRLFYAAIDAAYADAARIAREWPREGTGAGTDDLASSTIARAIEARAREVSEGKGEG